MARQVLTVTIAVIVTLVLVWLASAEGQYRTYLPVVARGYDGMPVTYPTAPPASAVELRVRASERRSDPGAVLTVEGSYRPYDDWLFTVGQMGAYYRVGDLYITATLTCDGAPASERSVIVSSYDYSNIRGAGTLVTDDNGQVTAKDWVRNFDIGRSYTQFFEATCPGNRYAYGVLVVWFD